MGSYDFSKPEILCLAVSDPCDEWDAGQFMHWTYHNNYVGFYEGNYLGSNDLRFDLINLLERHERHSLNIDIDKFIVDHSFQMPYDYHKHDKQRLNRNPQKGMRKIKGYKK